jgi:hypothetical protein
VKNWPSRFSKGPCKDCKKTPRERGTTEFYKGRCIGCRHAVECRALIWAGVPCGTALILRTILLKCKTDDEANTVLALVHPRVMANVVVKDKTLVLKSARYRWLRRNGWFEA